MKLLKPKTRMATPVNWTTSVRLEWKALISSGNMGASASGVIDCVHETAVAAVRHENFQNGLQF